jgi:hypothetical protein
MVPIPRCKATSNGDPARTSSRIFRAARRGLMPEGDAVTLLTIEEEKGE